MPDLRNACWCYCRFFRKPYEEDRMPGRIIIISGKSGKVLKWVKTPDGKESYFSPLVYTLQNGTDLVVFGTGGETTGGALYVIQLHDLYDGKIDLARAIYADKFKGTFYNRIVSRKNYGQILSYL